MFSVTSKSVEETARIAEVVARHLREGDVVLLTGQLACGKTYFAKGLAAALGSSDLVTSPTYTLVHSYTTATSTLLHIDLYRIASIREFWDLGLDEYFGNSITVIEWGDKVASEFHSSLRISFDMAGPNENHRHLEFSFTGSRWKEAFLHLRTEIGDFADVVDSCD